MNTSRHNTIFSHRHFDDKEIHIIGSGNCAKKITYLLAKLGCKNLFVHSFQDNTFADLKNFARELESFSASQVSCVMHEDASWIDATWNDIVFVAEELSEIRPSIYDFLSTSLYTKIIFDVQTDKMHQIATYTPEELFSIQDQLKGSASSDPLQATVSACWAVNQFLTWSQIETAIKGKEDRSVLPIQKIDTPIESLPFPKPFLLIEREYTTLQNTPVHIIGTGATGSHIVQLLIECGFKNIHAYDFDTIEPHNIANQWYKMDQIGKTKVDALYENTQEITIHNEKVEEGHIFDGIVFLLTDSMPSRKEINRDVLKKSTMLALVETRMGVEKGQTYVVNPEISDRYTEWENTLFDTEKHKPEVSACGSAITIVTTAMLTAAYAIQHLIENHCGKEKFLCTMVSTYPPRVLNQ